MGTVSSLAQTLSLTGLFTNPLDLSTPGESITIPQSQIFTDGTGANQVGEIWHDRIALVANTPQHLDLYGTLTNAFTQTVNFATIKVLYIRNKATTTAYDLTISGTFMDNDLLGGGASTIILGPSGVCLLTSPMDGYDVTDTTGERITLNPGAVNITCDVFLAGTV